MLKIPSREEQPPPLVVPVSAAEGGTREKPRTRRVRKRKRAQHEESMWEQNAGGEQSAGEESQKDRGRGWLVWQLVAGTVVFAVLVTWVALTLRARPAQGGVAAGAPTGQVADDRQAPPAGEQREDGWHDAVRVEKVCRAFLEAGSIDELLANIRDRERLEQAIRGHYADEPPQAAGMTACSTAAVMNQDDCKALVASVMTRTRGKRQMVLCLTSDGLKVDWESWVGHSEVPWNRILESRPTAPVLVRVVLSPVDYYNMDFVDDKRWRSCRLLAPDGEHLLFGYFDMSQERHVRWIEAFGRAGVAEVPVTLTIRYAEGARSRNQVLVDEVLADGWFLPKKHP